MLSMSSLSFRFLTRRLGGSKGSRIGVGMGGRSGRPEVGVPGGGAGMGEGYGDRMGGVGRGAGIRGS